MVANSTTEAEYIAASSCCGQVLWIQNQLLDYGYNFMHTKIFTDNNRKAKKSVRLCGIKTDRVIYLQLEDAEGVDCLPNATIFEELTLMGYEQVSQKLTFFKAFFPPQWKFLIHTVLQCLSLKTTAWNKFSSNISSHIICLATSQKLSFSKLIFKSIVKNLDNVGKFLMYPRFIQVFLDKQLEDEAVNEEMDDSLVRATTTASSLEAEQYSGNIDKTQSKAIPNEPSSSGTSSGSGPRRQETMGDTIAQIGFENVSKISNDSLLVRVNTPRSDEDSMKLKELMEFCTKLQQRALDLENIKTAQAQEITSLKLRVKKLEKKGGLRTHKLKRLYKVGRSARVISSYETSLGNQEDASKKGRKINDIDKDAEITLVDETQGRIWLKKEISVAEKEVSTADLVTTAGEVVTTTSVEISTASQTETIIADDLTLAQTLIKIRSATPKVKRAVIGEQSESITRTRPQQLPSKDKGKAIMEEPEKPTKRKKDRIWLKKEISVAEKEVSTVDLVTTAGEVVTTASVEISTASQTETIIADDLTLIEIRSANPKVKGVVIGEQSESITRTRPQQLPSKDKHKAIMEEPEKPTKRKDQIRHDEEVAQRLQAQMQDELEEEDRHVRKREEEANIVSWDNVQAMIDVDYQMAQQMQAEEQEKLSIEEKSKLFVQLLEARKKHFAAMRAQEKRNKPPTKAQKRKTMSTYLKNMAGYKHNQLKNKSFDDIQKLFDKAMKRVNTFVDMDTELVEGSEVRAEGSETRAEGSSKRAGEELEQESSKKQKLEEDKESEELKKCLEIVPDDGDDVTIDATPLSIKSPSIVDWKIHKEGKKSYYQIIRADGSLKMYLVFSHMLKGFDREDLETLYKLVKAKYGSTRPV
ncbi:hypothetical protein Tco_0195560 [Tanacetum coccineum]